MQHPLALAVLNQLLLERPEQRGVERFELKIDLIGTATATFQGIFAIALQTMRDQAAALRERMIRGRGDFREGDPLISPRHQVTGACDLGFGLIASPLNRTCLMHLEQFRVQRATVELKHQLSDFGTNNRQRIILQDRRVETSAKSTSSANSR